MRTIYNSNRFWEEKEHHLKRGKKIWSWLAGTVLLPMLVVGGLMLYQVKSTRGEKIAPYANPQTALLVIDIQEDYTGPQARKPYHDAERIVAATNALLAQARQRGMVVVYIENVIDNRLLAFFTGGINAPGAPGTEMDRRLLAVPGAITLTKKRADAFSNPELDGFLRAHRVNRVLLTGLDAAYCVNATAGGALNRGYQVTLFPEAIATESGKSLSKLAAEWREAGAQVMAGSEL